MYLRIILFVILFYLVVRLIKQFLSPSVNKKEEKIKSSNSTRKVSKEVGDYVDFEEINERKNKR